MTSAYHPTSDSSIKMLIGSVEIPLNEVERFLTEDNLTSKKALVGDAQVDINSDISCIHKQCSYGVIGTILIGEIEVPLKIIAATTLVGSEPKIVLASHTSGKVEKEEIEENRPKEASMVNQSEAMTSVPLVHSTSNKSLIFATTIISRYLPMFSEPAFVAKEPNQLLKHNSSYVAMKTSGLENSEMANANKSPWINWFACEKGCRRYSVQQLISVIENAQNLFEEIPQKGILHHSVKLLAEMNLQRNYVELITAKGSFITTDCEIGIIKCDNALFSDKSISVFESIIDYTCKVLVKILQPLGQWYVIHSSRLSNEMLANFTFNCHWRDSIARSDASDWLLLLDIFYYPAIIGLHDFLVFSDASVGAGITIEQTVQNAYETVGFLHAHVLSNIVYAHFICFTCKLIKFNDGRSSVQDNWVDSVTRDAVCSLVMDFMVMLPSLDEGQWSFIPSGVHKHLVNNGETSHFGHIVKVSSLNTSTVLMEISVNTGVNGIMGCLVIKNIDAAFLLIDYACKMFDEIPQSKHAMVSLRTWLHGQYYATYGACKADFLVYDRGKEKGLRLILECCLVHDNTAFYLLQCSSVVFKKPYVLSSAASSSMLLHDPYYKGGSSDWLHVNHGHLGMLVVRLFLFGCHRNFKGVYSGVNCHSAACFAYNWSSLSTPECHFKLDFEKRKVSMVDKSTYVYDRGKEKLPVA